MSRLAFKDHFSGHATLYRQARPLPPASYADWLAGQVSDRALAWDAGCGNGQATLQLAGRFERVIGSDPSATQIAAAAQHSGVTYRVEAAERCSLADGSVDLVSVSQALHWFDLPAFYAQVRRVLKPGGVLAVSAYGNCSVDPAVDAIEQRLYAHTLGAYWPAERALVDAGYRGLPFPFARIDTPCFEMVARWTLTEFTAYLRSWSSAQRYLKATGEDAVAAALPALTAAWGDARQTRTVRWPFFALVGRSD